MRLAPKLVLLMVGVAAVPLALAGGSAIHLSGQVTRNQVEEAHLRLAENLGDSVHDFIMDAGRSLAAAASTFQFDQLGPQRRRDAMKVLFFQMGETDTLALVDAGGKDVVESVYVSPGEQTPDALQGHVARDAAAIDAFHRKIPLQAALSAGAAASQLYDADGAGGPHVAVAVQAGPGLVLAAEVSLDKVRAAIQSFHIGLRGEAFLLDTQGAIAVAKDPKRVGQNLASDPFLRGCLANHLAASGEFAIAGEKFVGAYAPEATTGWAVLIAQPESDALVASRRLSGQTALWCVAAMIAAVVMAFFYAGEVSRPVAAVARGAGALAKGELATRIKVESRDEIGDLAGAFNEMAAKLEASIREIERQNDEIKGWNATLAQKVEERTRELREAQAQLVQSKKLAALGELGAGVAHELNNPLAGIKGFAQLMLMSRKPEDKEYKPLKNIEEGARRCAEIVTRLLRFSQEAASNGRERVDLNGVVKESFTLFEQRLKEANIKAELKLGDGLPTIVGSKGELREVCWHILSNAKNAMPNGGTLTVTTWTEQTPQGDEVKVSFSDTGKGIDPEIADRIFEPFFTTKDQWRGTGLGLAVVHRIVTDHGGTIAVVSKPGAGATFTLSFPKGVDGVIEQPVNAEAPATRTKTQLV